MLLLSAIVLSLIKFGFSFTEMRELAYILEILKKLSNDTKMEVFEPVMCFYRILKKACLILGMSSQM